MLSDLDISWVINLSHFWTLYQNGLWCIVFGHSYGVLDMINPLRYLLFIKHQVWRKIQNHFIIHARYLCVPIDVSALVKNLKKSTLIAECPNCSGEFKMSKAILFDGRGKFPTKAEEKRQAMLQELKDRAADLLIRKEKATIFSERTTTAVGIGKTIEKILPAHRNFDLTPSDCRFLAEPIDMIVFDGITQNKVNKITFLDVKTGAARLNNHQKQIRDAINDHNVKWRQY